MNHYCLNWLKEQLPELVKNQVINDQTASSIKDYYDKKIQEEITAQKNAELERKKQNAKNIPIILSIIAVVLIAGGIISLIAYNWRAIGRLAKSIAAILLLVITQGVGAYLLLNGKAKVKRIKESVSLFWAIIFGAVVAFVSQIYKFPGDPVSFLLLWSLSSIFLTYLFDSTSTFVLSLFQIFALTLFAFEEGNLHFSVILTLLLIPFAIKKDIRKIALLTFSLLLFCPIIAHLPVYQNIKNMIFVALYSSTGLICLRSSKKEIKYGGAILLFVVALLTTWLLTPLEWNCYTGASKETLISISSVAGLLFVASTLLPFYLLFVKKERFSNEMTLSLLPPILSLVALLQPSNSIKLTIENWNQIFLSPYALLILFLAFLFVIYALKQEKPICYSFFFLYLSCFFYIIKEASVEKTIVYFLASIMIFAFVIFLRRKKVFVSAEKEIDVAISVCRGLTALFLLALSICVWGETSFFYSSKGAPLLFLLAFIPPALFSCVLLIQSAVQLKKNFIEYADIPLNLLLVSLVYGLAQASHVWLNASKFQNVFKLVMTIILFANFIFSMYRIILNKQKSFIEYPIAIFVMLFVSMIVFEKSILFTLFFTAALAALFLHFAGLQFKNKYLTNAGMNICGLLLFIEVAFWGTDDFHFVAQFDFYSIFFAVLCLFPIVFLGIKLFKSKKIFNPAFALNLIAILFFPLCERRFCIVASLLLTMLFCAYYMYVAYVNASPKTANVSAIYFCVVIMTRFFLNGYGLIPQGITLIALGIFTLLVNRFIIKGEGKDER